MVDNIKAGPIKWVHNKVCDFRIDQIDKMQKQCYSIDCIIDTKMQQLDKVNSLKDRLEEEIKILRKRKNKINKKIKPYIT